MAFVLRVTLSLAAVALCGCALKPFGRDREPVYVDVLSVEVPTFGEERAEVKVAFDVHNPEGAPGQVERVEWELWLDGRWFAAGQQALGEPLSAAGARVSVDLPVVYRRLTLQQGPTPAALGVRGTLRATAGRTHLRLPFERILTTSCPAKPALDASSED